MRKIERGIIMVIMSIFVMSCCTVLFAATWEERQAAIKEIVDAEVERIHELRLEKAKAEVYAKELQLQATQVNVRAYTSNKTEITNSVTQENK